MFIRVDSNILRHSFGTFEEGNPSITTIGLFDLAFLQVHLTFAANPAIQTILSQYHRIYFYAISFANCRPHCYSSEQGIY